MKKIIISLFVLSCLPWAVFAQAEQTDKTEPKNEVFQAQVIEVIRQERSILPSGEAAEQQNLKLQGLDGDYQGKTIIFEGIGNFDVLSKNLYKTGDKVIVQADANDQGEKQYFVTDYVRTDAIIWIAGIFIAVILAVGRIKGVRSLLSLAASFAVIIYFLLPQITSGSDPVVVTAVSSLVILLAVVYLTEGFNIDAHIAVASIFFSLLLTIGLSWLFVSFAHLSGFASEEASFLVSFGATEINFKGLLLAGIIIGALGVLDDVVISQITAVRELVQANPGQSFRDLFRASYNIGISHISSMTNTLFLAYAGASLPLLLLINQQKSSFSSLSSALNNESLATEIIRTMAGSVGLVLAVPLTTVLACYLIPKFKNDYKHS